MGTKHRIRVLRADSGFFDDKLLSFLEQRQLPYIVVARLTPWLKRQAAQVQQWTKLDDNYSVGEFRLQLHGWEQHRRFVVIRERVREGNHRRPKADRCSRLYLPHLRHHVHRRLRKFGATTTGAPTWKIASRS